MNVYGVSAQGFSVLLLCCIWVPFTRSKMAKGAVGVPFISITFHLACKNKQTKNKSKAAPVMSTNFFRLHVMAEFGHMAT